MTTQIITANAQLFETEIKVTGTLEDVGKTLDLIEEINKFFGKYDRMNYNNGEQKLLIREEKAKIRSSARKSPKAEDWVKSACKHFPAYCLWFARKWAALS